MARRLSEMWDAALLERVAGFFRTRKVEAYLVGGTVRDWLLGRPSQDLDLAVAGDALILTRTLADELGAAYVPLDMEHATARAVLRRPRICIDIARLRGETLAADLTARDFTVNAMAVRLEDALSDAPELIDPLGGQIDLRARRIRAISEAAFQDDPLRLLRAVRLAAELSFDIEPQTQAWIAGHAAAIGVPAAERVRDELVRIFVWPGTPGALRLLDELGLLPPLLPELVAGKGVVQPAIHQWDVFEHLVRTVEQMEHLLGMLGVPSQRRAIGVPKGEDSSLAAAYAQVQECLAPFVPQLRAHLRARLVGDRPRFALLKLVALLHDIGKPETRSVDDAGKIHFYHHEQVGAKMVAGILRRLHFGNREVKIGHTVTFHHMRPKWLAGVGKATRRAIYRFFRDTRASGVDVILLSMADTLAIRAVPTELAGWEAQLDITHRLLEAWFRKRDSLVSPPALVRGTELIESFNLEPGPVIGELLEAIREAQAVGRVTNREEALAFARDWLAGSAQM